MKEESLRSGARTLRVVSGSAEETRELGRDLGRLLGLGDVVALSGELGSGKTCFAQGLALGLEVDPGTVVNSPSFALVNEYKGKYRFYHMDFYRLTGRSDLASTGLEEYFEHGCPVIVEWADRWPDLLPERTLEVRLTVLNGERRQVRLVGRHPGSAGIVEALRQSWGRE